MTANELAAALGVGSLIDLAELLAELVRWREDNSSITNPEIALLHGGRSDLATLHRLVVWGPSPATDPAPAPRGPTWDAMRRPPPSPEATARWEAEASAPAPIGSGGRYLTDTEREGTQP